MRILLVTPLYPPDEGRIAAYVKALAGHLAEPHTVSVLTYGNHPETTPSVTIHTVSKRLPWLIRIALFTVRLWRISKHVDVLCVQDGASVGVPSILVGKAHKLPVIRHFYEDEVEKRLSQAVPETQWKLRFINFLQRWVATHANLCLAPTPSLEHLLVETYQIKRERVFFLPHPPRPAIRLPFPVERDQHQLLILKSLSTEHKNRIEQTQKTHPTLNIIDAPSLGQLSRAEYWHLLQTSAALLVDTDVSLPIESRLDAASADLPIVTVDNLSTFLNDQAPKDRIRKAQQQLLAETSWKKHLESLLALCHRASTL